MSQSPGVKVSRDDKKFAPLSRVEWGQRLRDARLAGGFETVRDAAEALGMNEVAYGDLERGKKVCSALRLYYIVVTLELDPVPLFAPPDLPTPPARKRAPDRDIPEGKPGRQR
jgi:transcriptional regulator with XRE-family HTH domain